MQSGAAYLGTFEQYRRQIPIVSFPDINMKIDQDYLREILNTFIESPQPFTAPLVAFAKRQINKYLEM